MRLKCRINNIDYDMVQGAHFRDEFGETLDSGAIIISHVPKIYDLEPYDDVFIWNSDEQFNGYNIGDNDEELVAKPRFYKHLLVDRFSETRLNVVDNLYEYKIELFSETKRLEKVSLPNINITQPLKKDKKINSYERMRRLLELYSPHVKIARDASKWDYTLKYKLSKQVKDLFEKEYCYDFSLNQPTLREALSKIMITLDCIPYVKDDVIYAMDLSKRKETVNLNEKNTSKLVATKTSQGYVDTLKTTYSNALNMQNACHRVEYLGFRNSDESLLTLDNMRLETTFPIYKITKMYACYYKDVNFANGKATFLCKQDITDLCVLEKERQLLWRDPRLSSFGPTDVRMMKNYYFYTVGYSIGSNIISGFGAMFNIKKNFGLLLWDKKANVIRNILKNLDAANPFGSTHIKQDFESYEASLGAYQGVSTNDLKVHEDTGIMSNRALSYKTLFFQVEYDAMFNGVIENDKNNKRSGITTTDNQSASLTLLDIDGISKKHKIDKFGNKNFQMCGRYNDLFYVENGQYKTNLLDLASVVDFSTQNNFLGSEDDDVVLYSREYTIKDNSVDVNYFGAKDYVLKNYFTSVYAKQRLFNVLDYGESVNRAEIRKSIILLSKNKQYFMTGQPFSYSLDKVFSFCRETEETDKPINIAYIKTAHDWRLQNTFDAVADLSYGTFFSDANIIVSGNNLSFNTKMATNFSTGTSIVPSQNTDDSDKRPYEPSIYLSNDANDNFKGSLQRDNAIYDDYETGTIENLIFGFGNYNDNFSTRILTLASNATDAQKELYEEKIRSHIERSFALPSTYCAYANDALSKDQFNFLSNRIYPPSSKYANIYKDTKEQLDMTYQIECMVDADYKKSIFISDKMLQLSEYYGLKKEDDYSIVNEKIELFGFQYRAIDVDDINVNSNNYVSSTFGMPAIVVKVSADTANLMAGHNNNFVDIPNFSFNFNTSYAPDSTATIITDGSSRIPNLYGRKYYINNFVFSVDKLKITKTEGNNFVLTLSCTRRSDIRKLNSSGQTGKYEDFGYSQDTGILINLYTKGYIVDHNLTPYDDTEYLYFSNVAVDKDNNEQRGRRKGFAGLDRESGSINDSFYFDWSIKKNGTNEIVALDDYPTKALSAIDSGQENGLAAFINCFQNNLYTVKFNYFYHDTYGNNTTTSYEWSPYYLRPYNNFFVAETTGNTTDFINTFPTLNCPYYSQDYEQDLVTNEDGDQQPASRGTAIQIDLPTRTETDAEGHTCIYSSAIIDTTIGNKNIFCVLSNDKITQKTVYSHKESMDEFRPYFFETQLVSDIVFVNVDSEIIVYLRDLPVDFKDFSSFQIWYYDYNEKMYYFVFGINLDNLTEEEIETGMVTIYLSKMLDKDLRVFDENHNLIGYIHNSCADNVIDADLYDRINNE